MSELLKKFEESNKPRPAQAKQIPQLATDFFDSVKRFAAGFSTFQKKGDPTQFTNSALAYFDTEHKEITLPSNFVPTDQGVDVSRWTPDNTYFAQGQAK